MEDRRSIAVPVAIAAIVLLILGLYVGSYYALLNPDADPFGNRFRVGGIWTDRFYQPVYLIDRKIRPDYPHKNPVYGWEQVHEQSAQDVMFGDEPSLIE